MNELDTLLRWLTPVLLGVIAYFVREGVEQMKRIAARVQAHAESLAQGSQRFGDIERRLGQLEGRVDEMMRDSRGVGT